MDTVLILVFRIKNTYFDSGFLIHFLFRLSAEKTFELTGTIHFLFRSILINTETLLLFKFYSKINSDSSINSIAGNPFKKNLYI